MAAPPGRARDVCHDRWGDRPADQSELEANGRGLRFRAQDPQTVGREG